MIVGLLGILKAGGAYLPLNFEHPPARLAHQLRETGARSIVTQEALLERLPEFDGEIVCLDRDRDSARRASRAHRAGRVGRARQPRLRDLHVGLDRHAEGCRRHARATSRTTSHAIGAPPRRRRGAARVRDGDRDLHRSRQHRRLPGALLRRDARARQPGCRCRTRRRRRRSCARTRSTCSRSRRRI